METRIVRRFAAPRERVYRALVDPEAVVRWKVPSGMSAEVHEFEPHAGGRIRISLTYTGGGAAGKTAAHTDTYHGTIVELVENERLVEVDEFETDDPDLRGEMRITITLTESGGETELRAVHAGLPRGVPVEDNDRGWREALDRLAELVET